MERKTGREMQRSKEAGGKSKRKRKSIRERKSKSRGRKRECGGERKRLSTIRELWQVQSFIATFPCSTCFDLFLTCAKFSCVHLRRRDSRRGCGVGVKLSASSSVVALSVLLLLFLLLFCFPCFRRPCDSLRSCANFWNCFLFIYAFVYVYLRRM